MPHTAPRPAKMPHPFEAVLLGLLPLLLPVAAVASGGAFPDTAHGDPVRGVQRRTDVPAGECGHCHTAHGSLDGTATGTQPHALFAPDDNGLCAACHTPSSDHAWPGPVVYDQSSHAREPGMVWPGPTPPARTGAEAGLCLNCHDPHGIRDALGVLPSLTSVREEEGCLTCHDGSPAFTDVRSAVSQAYRHPVELGGRHHSDEGGDPGAHAVDGAGRHAECVDCHNPHEAREDLATPTAPWVSNRLRGVSRVQVTNGPAGTVPGYTWSPASDDAFAREYEVCFKCHSSWTTQPPGQPDLAHLLNPNNPSFHPIEAQGRNAHIDPLAFVDGWTWDRLVYCSDCHGSDDTVLRGPHGSIHEHLLRKPYPSSSVQQAMTSGDLCFDCHAWDTYASQTGGMGGAALSYSRFNPPGARNGHAWHVGTRRTPCTACHAVHGSVVQPFLITTGRSPGIVGFTASPTGGACTSTCHMTRSYTVNYPR